MAHLRNTAAGLNGIAPAYDALCGWASGLYGLKPAGGYGAEAGGQWKTRVSYVKTLEAKGKG